MIIIDTFGSLNSQLHKIKEDKLKVCFICGLSREILDKNANSYFTHIEVMHLFYLKLFIFQEDHYMWNYLYYHAYLLHKDPDDLNEIESCVLQKIKQRNIDWFPINK